MNDNDETTAVLLIAHGSRHQPANDDLRAMATRMSSERPDLIVEACFLELASPEIAEAGDRVVQRGASRVLMIPYFLSMGVHLIRDLTAARESLTTAHPSATFLLGPPLGPDPLLDQLVRTRIDELNTGASEPVEFPSSEATVRYPSIAEENPACERSSLLRRLGQ